jgi:hypothetical protein
MVGVLPSRAATPLDRLLHVALGGGLGVEALELPQRQRGEHRAGPGAEILRRDRVARDFAQVGVDHRPR